MPKLYALKDIAEVFNGKTPSNQEKRNSGNPILKIINVGSDGFFKSFDSYVDDSFYKRYASKRLKAGDTLILNAAHSASHVGSKTYYVEPQLDDVIATGEWLIIRGNEEIVNKRYLHYLLTSSRFKQKISTLIKGIHLYPKDIMGIKLQIPNMEEQLKNVSVLDSVHYGISMRNTSIKRLEDLTHSIFLDMFGDLLRNEKGWKKAPLGSICNIRSSIRVFKSDLVASGIPFYRGQEIKDLSLNNEVTTDLFISNEHYQEIKNKDEIPSLRDLLLPSICPEGEIWVVDSENPFYFKDGRVLWIQKNEGVLNSIYLKYFLKTLFSHSYENIASGTTFKELKIFILKNLEILIPPIELQNKFSIVLEEIVQSKNSMGNSYKRLDLLHRSVAQQVFAEALV